MGVAMARYIGNVPRNVRSVIDEWCRMYQYNVTSVVEGRVDGYICIDVYIHWGCSGTALKKLIDEMSKLGYEFIWVSASDDNIDLLFAK